MIRDFSTLTALSICVLMVVFYEYGLIFDDQGNVSVGPTVPAPVNTTIIALGWLQIANSVVLLLGQLITRGNLIIKSGWRRYVEENRFKYANLLSSKKDSGETQY